MAHKNTLGRTESDADTPQIRYAPTGETDIFYPESDGKPMAETERHRDLLINTLLILQTYFQDIPDVCVSGNMMMYYVEGNPRKSISPDIFVTFGVGRKERRTYRIWDEGKPPDFVLEFSSGNTYRNDLRGKKALYAEIGIGEYFLYDPERRYLPSPLMGFVLVGSDYVPIPFEADGSAFSATLGLAVRLRGEGLGFYDPVSEEWLQTPAEIATAYAAQAAERAEREAERAEREAERAEQEAAAREQAEAEVVRLREEIEQLKERD